MRRIRAGLRELGLDWNAPPYPEPGKTTLGPLEITVIGTEQQLAKTLLDLSVNPFDAEARLRLGILLVEEGQLDTGHAHLMVALALRPEMPAARSFQVLTAFQKTGAMHLRERRWKEAADAYEQVARFEPADSVLLMQAAALYLAAGDRINYRRACAQMLDRFGDSKSINALERTVKHA